MTNRQRTLAKLALAALAAGALGLPQGAAAAGPTACTASLSPPAGQGAAKSGDALSFRVVADAGEDRSTFVADILRLRADGSPNQSSRRVPAGSVGGSGGEFTGSVDTSFAAGTERARLVARVGSATCESPDLDVDLTPPALAGYALVDTTHVLVTFSEPVTLLPGDQLGPEESSWRVDGSMPVDVEGAPATGTRSLRLAQAVGEDATPLVEYAPGNQAPPYADRAGNVVGASGRVGNAVDAVAPMAPVIDAIEGTAPGSDNEVAGTAPSPDVTVGSVTAGHTIRLFRVDPAGPVPVGSTVAAGSTVSFTDVALASASDGTYRIVADATDPSANTTGGEPVSYRLDRTAPAIVSAAIAADAIQVDFSEDVAGPDLATDWNLAGPSDVVAVGAGAGPSQRILPLSLPVTAGTTLGYAPATERYTDAAGNGVADVTVAVAALPPPAISLAAPAAVPERATSVAFTLRMSSPSALPATAEWRTVDGTARGAGDYTADSGQVVFAPNEVEETIIVELRDDAVDEDDETFAVELLSTLVVPRDPSRSSATATIVDDDPLPVVAAEDGRVTEPATGTQRVNLPVRLERVSGRTVTVPWSTAAGTAQAGTDFVAATGSVTFAAGATTATIALDVLADDAGEPSESFGVTFGAPTNATLRRPSVMVAILDADGGVPPVELVIDRLAGSDRSGTSAAVSAAVFDAATDVVIARRDLYPDALAAGPLAASLGAPVLLTSPDGLDATTMAEIRRLGATTAHLMGGRAALGAGVEDDLRESTGVTSIERYAGTDRFDTARVVAEAIGGTRAYVVEGSNARADRGWPDAVGVGALAAHERRPLLLVTSDEIPQPTMLAIERLGLEEATVIGGTASVSAAVAADLEGAGVAVERVAGATRYDTSLAVARLAESSGLAAATTWVASGSDWPDALAAGPAAAADGGVLLLSDGSRLSSAAATWFADHAGEVTRVVLVGGTSALDGALGDDIRRYATVE